ncbi:MAG: hypothetical protein QM638_13545 [Nocardioides sp.]|uniref:VOC family protein n=1 Tax=Nocardioides sp. TaxID=35761 RepID=UPI0039E32CEC
MADDCVACRSGRHLLLEVPGPPGHSEETAAQVRDLVTEGVLGVAAILTTDDCQRTYDELWAKDVEFTEEPTEEPYGVDCALRDPFGNHLTTMCLCSPPSQRPCGSVRRSPRAHLPLLTEA